MDAETGAVLDDGLRLLSLLDAQQKGKPKIHPFETLKGTPEARQRVLGEQPLDCCEVVIAANERGGGGRQVCRDVGPHQGWYHQPVPQTTQPPYQ